MLRRVPARVLKDGDVVAVQEFKDWGASAARAVAAETPGVDRLAALIARYRAFEEHGR